jgi:hypothetical protein
MFLPNENTAMINKSLCKKNDPRETFTLYHEVVGHGILHGPYLRAMQIEGSKLYTTEKEMFDINNPYERQANFFAANVAAPTAFIEYLFKKILGYKQKINYMGPGKYCLFARNGKFTYVNVSSPYELAYKIAKKIRIYFGRLSMEALSIQVQKVCINSNGHTNMDFRGDDRRISKIIESMSFE